MKAWKHSLTLPILILILSVLVVGLVFTIVTNRFFPTVNFVKQGVSRWVEKTGLRPKSSLEINEELGEASDSGRLVFKFSVVNRDQLNVKQLSDRLGIGEDWINGIAINLNSQSLEKLKPLLPARVNLEFKEGEVNFSSGGGLALKSSLPEKSYQVATGGGILNVRGSGVENFDLQVTEPAKLALESSRSGKLYLSKQLSGFLSVLEKVISVSLTVNDKNMMGNIKLK